MNKFNTLLSSLLVPCLALLVLFYMDPSATLKKNMWEEAPKSVYDFTVKVLFLTSYWLCVVGFSWMCESLQILLLFFLVNV